MTDAHRRKMAKIMGYVIEGQFTVEHLDIIFHTCLALEWSPETNKLARIAYSMTKEIIHRDNHFETTPTPWQNLLSNPIEAPGALEIVREMRRDAEFQLVNEAAVEPEPREREVEVCDECHRACCWQGEFMCDGARDAGTTFMSITELKKLNKESPHYWEKRSES